MSQLVSTGTGKVGSSSTSSFSSSSSSSFSASSSSSSKVVKSSSSSASKSISSSSSKSSSVSIKSSGGSFKDKIASDLGIDVSQEMGKLKLRMDEEMLSINSDLFRLMPMTPPLALTSGPALSIEAPSLEDTLVRLDADAIKSCIDKDHTDRMRLNFDVTEFESESISVKTVGNKIEVHAQKKSKKGDEERNEEFSRVYELPTSNSVDPLQVSSSIYKDGVLTIELPVSEALSEVTPA